jgi:alkanesulfonate monooxygenase SsuD/methylene tetrahydromethanopterin reductase-like flavin-dependent oxidoreductase (luciferase family)
MCVRHGLTLPLFGSFADLSAVVDIAEAADDALLDGIFFWDHVLSPVDGDWAIADPWVALSAVAARTSRISLGPMVTPLARRRLATLVRTTMSLDQLSSGRLILGLGLGGDRARELSAFGEPDDRAARAAKLTEGAVLLRDLWAGERVEHHSQAWVVDNVRLEPVEGQRRRIPIWFASTNGALAPARRAARYEGLYPIDIDVEGFKRLVAAVHDERGSIDGFEFAVPCHPRVDAQPYVDAGATWLLHAFWPGNTPDQVIRFIESNRSSSPPTASPPGRMPVRPSSPG